MFKTAENLKRNKVRISNLLSNTESNWIKIWHAILEGVHHTVHGLKNFGKDSKVFFKSKVNAEQYSLVSYDQELRERNMKEDFLKMIPFSFFLIVPGAELLLPFWLSIFPNSLPSQFISEADRLSQFKSRRQKQTIAAEKLIYIWPNYFSKLLKDNRVDEEDKPLIKKLRDVIRNEKALPTDLLEYRFLFNKYCSFKQFQVKYLLQVSHFMSHEPVTGLTIINRVLKLPSSIIKKFLNINIPVFQLNYEQHWLIEAYVKLMVKRDLNLLFNRLRVEDQLISAQNLNDFPPQVI